MMRLLAKAFSLAPEKYVTLACALGLVAMALMCWSVLDPTPFPVIVAMSVGQAIGTLSLLCYSAAVFVHGRRRRHSARAAAQQGSPPTAH
jgi:hypothetical protein